MAARNLLKSFGAKFFSSHSGSSVRARKYILVKQFQGEPKKSDFDVVEEQLPALKNGEFLAEAEYLSVDPYMRAYMIRYKLPVTMIGGQVARILESKNPKYPVGGRVVGSFGWRTHTVVDPTKTDKGNPLFLLPDLGKHPSSLGLGILGMPGNTAYFGLLEVCKPQAGETVVVTGAAGAVGSHVGQIAKIKGCQVIGFAGSDEKCDYLKKELGFDHAFNYKKVNARKAILRVQPKGANCYFDNVGGEISSEIMTAMDMYGRVAVCGSISSYNDDIKSMPKVTITQPAIVFKELKIEGFLVTRWGARWEEGIRANLQWLNEGKLKYQEKRWEGFDSMVEALVGMLRGENTGKAIVKV